MNIDSGRCLARLRGHTDEITHCVFSPDGASVLSASYDCTLRAWDAAPPPAESESRGETLSHAFTKASFAPDGRTLLFAAADGKLVLAAGDTAAALRTLPGHAKGVSYCEFSAGGTRIVSASDDYAGNHSNRVERRRRRGGHARRVGRADHRHRHFSRRPPGGLRLRGRWCQALGYRGRYARSRRAVQPHRAHPLLFRRGNGW